jgi:hypothetical protein
VLINLSNMKKSLYKISSIMVVCLLLFGCTASKLPRSLPEPETTELPRSLSAPETGIETEATDTATPSGVVPSEKTDANVCYVNGDGVRMREFPSTEARIIMHLYYCDEVKRLEDDGIWSKVNYQDTVGYIRNDLLSDTYPVPRTAEETSVETTTAPTENGNEIIRSPKIVVKKSERKLELWDGDNLYGTYPIGLGWNPEGDKKAEGDGRTPEGSYYVCIRNANSSFYLSLGVSYPNKEDAKEALDAGTINQSVYNQIAGAIDNKSCPPWNTALGGAIMIHGMGSSSDWTAGCVAVDNDVMDILWKHCPIKTPIIIVP